MLYNNQTANEADNSLNPQHSLEPRAGLKQLSSRFPVPHAPTRPQVSSGAALAGFSLLPCCSQVQGQPLMVQVSGGQLITSTGQPIMVQAVPGGQGQTIMQVPVSGTQGLQQVRHPGDTAQPGDTLGCCHCHPRALLCATKAGRGGAWWLWRGGNE